MAAWKEQMAVAFEARAGGRLSSDPTNRARRRATAGTLPPLARTLDGAVIPRLVLAGRVDRARRTAPCADDRAGALADLVLSRDADTARGLVDRLHDRGASFAELYLDVMAPAARRLGEYWVDDRCHFADVTLAVSRLHHLLHLFGQGFYAEDPHAETPWRALLLPAPGEQHHFGLAMVAEFFRRAGWDVWSGAAAARADLLRLVARERFDLVGLSTGCEGCLDSLPGLIHAIRHRSRTPDVSVFVGGPAFVERPELANAVGADATALDGRQAVEQAELLLSLRAAPRARRA